MFSLVPVYILGVFYIKGYGPLYLNPQEQEERSGCVFIYMLAMLFFLMFIQVPEMVGGFHDSSLIGKTIVAACCFGFMFATYALRRMYKTRGYFFSG